MDTNFTEPKPPVQPIPTNSNLKQVMLHNKELEKEISYQNLRLSEKLKAGGIEVVDSESLSSMINKVKIKDFPKWMPKYIWASATRTNTSTGINGMGSAIVGDYIYVFGGDGSWSLAYDIVKNSWVKLSAPPFCRTLNKAHYHDGHIYLVGFSSGDICCYNIASDSWQTKTPYQYGLGGSTSTIVGDNIYVFYSNASSKCVKYNITSDSWSEILKNDSLKYGATSCYCKNSIYVIGGQGSSLARVYDISTDSWTNISSLSETIMSSASVVIENKIYCIGGYRSGSYYSGRVYVYDTDLGSWEFLTDGMEGRSELTAQQKNGNIYIIGGKYSSSNSTPANDCLIIL